VDLTDLIWRHQQRKGPNVVCGIKVVGYHVTGAPGQQFGYAGETLTIPSEGFIEIISMPRVKHYTFGGRKRPLEAETGPMDAFSFRWIALPAVTEGGIHE
jgi:hypothetical protein